MRSAQNLQFMLVNRFCSPTKAGKETKNPGKGVVQEEEVVVDFQQALVVVVVGLCRGHWRALARPSTPSVVAAVFLCRCRGPSPSLLLAAVVLVTSTVAIKLIPILTMAAASV